MLNNNNNFTLIIISIITTFKGARGMVFKKKTNKPGGKQPNQLLKSYQCLGFTGNTKFPIEKKSQAYYQPSWFAIRTWRDTGVHLCTLSFAFQDLSITLMFTYLTVTLPLMFSDSDLKMQTTIFLLHNAFIPLLHTRNRMSCRVLMSWLYNKHWSSKIALSGVGCREGFVIWMISTWT